MQISQNVDRLVCTPVCFCACEWVCVCWWVSNWAASVYPSIRLFARLFIICLSSCFLSFLSVLCLSSAPGFPNAKWQQRGRQRGWRTFLMEGFYILTSLPSLLLNLVQWGGKTRRQTVEKNINKLHVNWFAAGLAQIVTVNHSHAHLPTIPQVRGWLDNV